MSNQLVGEWQQIKKKIRLPVDDSLWLAREIATDIISVVSSGRWISPEYEYMGPIEIIALSKQYRPATKEDVGLNVSFDPTEDYDDDDADWILSRIFDEPLRDGCDCVIETCALNSTSTTARLSERVVLQTPPAPHTDETSHTDIRDILTGVLEGNPTIVHDLETLLGFLCDCYDGMTNTEKKRYEHINNSLTSKINTLSDYVNKYLCLEQ